MRPVLSYLSPKARVQPSPIHGRGLFAASPMDAGEIVCVKGGYIFTRAALAEVAPVLGPAEIQIADDLFIGPRELLRAEYRRSGPNCVRGAEADFAWRGADARLGDDRR